MQGECVEKQVLFLKIIVTIFIKKYHVMFELPSCLGSELTLWGSELIKKTIVADLMKNLSTF